MAELSFDDLVPDYGRAISSIESGGNYKAIGPPTKTGDRAIGKYQVMANNIGPWSEEILGRKVTPQEFIASPEIQDKIFQGKFGQYTQKYGPEGAARAWFAGEGGMNDPNRKDVLGTTVADYGAKFTKAMGQKPPTDVSARAKAPVDMSFDDLIPAETPQPTIAERSDVSEGAPKNAPALQQGLEGQAVKRTQGVPVSSAAQITTNFMNQGSAAGQRTSPHIEAHQKNLISTKTYENDAGELLYEDNAGNLVKTDSNKHVALRDPADGVIKVYARSENTDEGILSSAGRLMMTGLGAGAPTARPAIPTPKPAATLSEGQEVANAASRLSATGSPVQVPKAVASDSMGVQRAAAVTRNVPLAGDPLVKAAERTIGQLGDKASEVAAGYGGGTVVGSGEAVRDSIKGYITGKSAATSSKLYNRVDELVDNSVLTPLQKTAEAASKIESRRQNAGISDASPVVKRIEEAISRDGLNYEGVKDLRGYIRELKDNPSLLPADLSGKELNAIYDGLTADLKAAVKNAGGAKASIAFDRANRHYALLSDRRESLAKIVGTNGDAPAEKVFDRMVAMASSKSTADISKLAQARKAMGADDWNEFVSGVVGKMGRDTANFSGPERLQSSGFSPQRFLTAYGKLSDAGKAMLFRSGGNAELANHLDDIARVSTRFKELQKFSNPSGTAQNVGGVGLGAGLIADPLTSIATVIGGRALAMALSQPAKASSIAKLVKSQEALVRNPVAPRIAAFNMAARNLISTMGDKTLSPADFLKALQGPVASRAEDEQQ